MWKIKSLFVLIASILAASTAASAQNIVAKEMCIYFGHPKKVTLTNMTGTTITEFDPSGRATNASMGNMQITYDWDEDGKSVTLSVLEDGIFKDSIVMTIIEDTPSKLEYNFGSTMRKEILFKENGAIDKAIVHNPYLTTTTCYYYNDDEDVFPHAVEVSMGPQSIKTTITVQETDAYGNALEFTQELMGNKDITKLTIEYY